LKKINQCDIIGAADEFLKWNKITVRGVKVPLKGLSARREDERLLFLKEDSTIG
jgi:lysozyme